MILAVLLCVGLGVVGSATNSFAPRVYHNVCTFGDCEVGRVDECADTYESGLSWYLGWVQVVLLILPSLISLCLTICLYVTVRAKLMKTRRFVFGSNDQQRNHQQDKLVAVRNQALLYALAYWNSFFWYFFYGVIGGDDYVLVEKEGEPFYFIIGVFVWFLFPLQGVVNFAVYTRPRYLQWRKANLSPCMALRKAISIEPVGATQHLRSTATTHASVQASTASKPLRFSLARAFGRQSEDVQGQDRTDRPEDSSHAQGVTSSHERDEDVANFDDEERLTEK